MQMAGRQTLDSNSPNGTAHRNEQESPQSCNSEGFCFFSSLHGISSHSLSVISICYYHKKVNSKFSIRFQVFLSKKGSYHLSPCDQTMEFPPRIGIHNGRGGGKTTGEGNRIRFPKQIQGDARVAEHAIGMTENCAVFRAECVKKPLQFLRADLPVNSLFRRESVLVEQQPRKRIIVRIVS